MSVNRQFWWLDRVEIAETFLDDRGVYRCVLTVFADEYARISEATWHTLEMDHRLDALRYAIGEAVRSGKITVTLL